MDKAIPSRPKRVKNPPVQSPEVLETNTENAIPTSIQPTNKYAPRNKYGKATIGAPNRVETVGLGKLKVITTNGYTDV